MRFINFGLFFRKSEKGIAMLAVSAAVGLQAVTGCVKTEPGIWKSPESATDSPDRKKVSVVFKPYIGYPEVKAADNTVRNLLVSIYSEGSLVEELNLGNGGEGSAELYTGKEYTYYASANLTRSTGLKTEAEIEAVRVPVNPSEPSGGFPMAAAGDFSVSEDDATVDIMLERLYSKIRFSVDFAETQDLDISSVRIKQAAASVTPFTRSRAVSVSDGDAATASEIITLNSAGQIEFYVPENCQGVLLPSNTDPSQKIPDNILSNAHLCTYIEVKGALAGEQIYAGEVTYRFYLGQDAASDFNVIRNTENTVTLVPSRDALGSPSWQIDTDKLYAEVPFVLFGEDGWYCYQYRDEFIRKQLQFSDYDPQWKKVLRTEKGYVGLCEVSKIADAMLFSADGREWDLELEDYLFGQAEKLLYGGGVFIATAPKMSISGKDPGYYMSTDGKDWNRRTTGYKKGSPISAAYGDGTFLLCGNTYVWTSTNAKSWNFAFGPAEMPFATFTDGKFTGLMEPGKGKAYTSSDKGKTWTKQTCTFDADASSYEDYAYGNGIHLMCTDTHLFRSSDCLTWQRVTALSGCTDFCVDFRDGVFIVAYKKSTGGGKFTFVSTSFNGYDWTEIASYDGDEGVTANDICIVG